MVTVKRPRKRSMINPKDKYLLLAALALAVVMMAAGIAALAGQARTRRQMDELSEYMAKSIRTELNQVIQCYGTLDRKSDSAAEQLASMKKYMYSAYGMNKILVESRGGDYSILDTASYNSFQTIAGEYERLLATGQATVTVKTALGDYMQSLEEELVSRFDSADLLLPQQASR